jgi:NAD(P)-dependent dehydrogenase (short-subunit alcohol dehydrogenase family)
MSAAVFGITSRIGREIALRLAEQGKPVWVGARDLAEAETIAADITIRTGTRAVAGRFDARDTSAMPALIASIEAEVGPLDHAVLAFGDMGDKSDPDTELTPEDLRTIVEVNYLGAATLAECLAQVMATRKAGFIAALGSVAGDRGRQSNYAYGSAKGALHLFLAGLRNRYFSRGVHVLTVKLGFIDTRMTWGLKTKIPVGSPESASRAVVEALDARRDEIYWPPFWRGIMGIIKAIPEAGFKRLSL